MPGDDVRTSAARSPISNLRLIRRFYVFLAPYKAKGFIALGCMLLSVALQIPVPFLTAYLIDRVATTQDYGLLAIIGLALAGTLVAQTVSSFLQNYLLMRFRARVLFDMRVHLFDHLQGLSARYFFKHQTGYLTARVGGDVQLVDGLLADAVLAAFQNVLYLITGIACTFSIQAKLGLISFAFIPLYGVIVLFFNARIRSMTWQMRELFADSQRVLQELIGGISVIQALNAEKSALLRLIHATRKTTQKDVQASRLGIVFALLTTFITAIAPIAIVLLGVAEIMAGRLTIGSLVAFSAFLRYLFSPTGSLLNLSMNVQKSLAAVERIVELLDTEPEIRDSPDARMPAFIRGTVDFQNVSFSYDTQVVLSDINLHIESGEVVAIVGPSGAGKSSLCSLITRSFDPLQGSVLVDGVDVAGIKLSCLRDGIAIIPQDVFLFHDTIRQNIRLGNGRATPAQFEAAAEQAQLHGFVSALPDGYDTVIGERGITLSGGERQRIAIARTILRNPRVLIMDESTSQLDSESSMLVAEAVRTLMKGRTTIIIAHRLVTVTNADKIVVLNEGRIVGIGKHDALYASCPLYHKLYCTQFAEGQES